jgi:hypothetical protein
MTVVPPDESDTLEDDFHRIRRLLKGIEPSPWTFSNRGLNTSRELGAYTPVLSNPSFTGVLGCLV